MEAIIIAVLVGIGVGIVVGALGAGGGILAVPALIYLLHQSPHAAATGSLVIVLATALTALPSRIRMGNVRFKDGFLFAVVSMLGSFLGARAASLVSGFYLLACFSLMITIMGGVMLFKGVRELRVFQQQRTLLEGGARVTVEAVRRGAVAIGIAALFTGFLTGFFGVGGGFIVVPMLTLVLGFNIREAAGTSLLIMVLAALSGLVSRWGQPVVVDWPVVFAFMVGSMSGSFVGGPLSQRAYPHTLTLIFASLLGFVGVGTALAISLS